MTDDVKHKGFAEWATEPRTAALIERCANVEKRAIALRAENERLQKDADTQVRMFIGWLSGDIPELRTVEVPLLADSWERFKAALAAQGSTAETTAKEGEHS